MMTRGGLDGIITTTILIIDRVVHKAWEVNTRQPNPMQQRGSHLRSFPCMLVIFGLNVGFYEGSQDKNRVPNAAKGLSPLGLVPKFWKYVRSFSLSLM